MLWLLLGLLVACWLCAWLKPGTDLASSAARAFDSSVLLLSRGGQGRPGGVATGVRPFRCLVSHWKSQQ